MKQEITYWDPQLMLAAAEKEMEPIPQERLFNDSRYQKLTERWCAGMLGVGYSKLVQPCGVAVNDGRYREDVDIRVRTARGDWDFQLAEVQEPGRRRGYEYKQLAAGRARYFAYSGERGKLDGPKWLADGASRKKEKRYSRSTDLHLLLYANFAAHELEYADVAGALMPFATDFASLWVVTSMHLCSIFSPPDLGEVKGWGVVRGIETYYT